jgi:hypothetical protein
MHAGHLYDQGGFHFSISSLGFAPSIMPKAAITAISDMPPQEGGP